MHPNVARKCLAVVLFPALASAATVPLGTDLLVNQVTAGVQSRAAVAADPSGRFVAAWQSQFQDGSDFGIFARRFGADGSPLGDEFLVNTETAGSQTAPSVATDGAGSFIVVWQSDGQDGDGLGVYGRRFASDGSALGSAFPVNQTTAGNQAQPRVASDASGNFVVAWQSAGQDGDLLGVFARRFGSNGQPLGDEFQVNAFTTGRQKLPGVAISPEGGLFVIAWQSFGQDGSGTGIFARRFGVDGQPLGGDIAVNAFTAGAQKRPAVFVESGGVFLVGWQSDGQDGSSFGVFIRAFDANGVPFASEEVPVNTFTTGVQARPAVAYDAAANYLVAWQSLGQDGDGSGIFAQGFTPEGVVSGGEKLVNSTIAGDQVRPSLAGSAADTFVAVWQSADGDATGIFARRFGVGPIVWVPDYAGRLVRIRRGNRPNSTRVTLSVGCAPNSVVVSGDELYVVCNDPDRILVYDAAAIRSAPAGAVLAGEPVRKTIDSAEFDGLIGAAFDSAGNLWVASNGNDSILRFSAASLATASPAVDTSLVDTPASPVGVAFDTDGSLWATGLFGDGILLNVSADQLAGDANPRFCISNAAPGCQQQPGLFDVPEGVAVFDGRIWVANNGGDAPGRELVGIRVAGGALAVDTVFGDRIQPSSLFLCPGGLFATSLRLWVNDQGFGKPDTTCGATDAGSGVGAVLRFTRDQLNAKATAGVVGFRRVTSRPGFGGIFVERE